MNEKKHTPGPWIAQRDIRHSTNGGTLHGGSPKGWAVYGPSLRVACVEESIGIDWDKDEEAKANAALIEAAPDMLEELDMAAKTLMWAAQEARGRVKAEIVDGWIHHANKCNQVIAKARGEA